ncbi:hypothetical protein FBU31_000111 [Coemansia sp. 'formosensis']|nr:hypothetical protein FBU31_000111 [Coemansia sp. 'formosensis']
MNTIAPTTYLEVMKCESILRMYNGLIWFFPHPLIESLPEVVEHVQKGVDKVVAATPELGGTLCEATPVRIEYTANGRVLVTSIEVPYTYAEMEKDGFNQEKYNLLFDHIPNLKFEIEGLATLRVWVFGLSCGGIAISIANHHILGDGAALSDLGISIGKACADPDYEPVAMWTSREQQHEMLMASSTGVKIDDSFDKHLAELIPTITGSGLPTQGRLGLHKFRLKGESLRRLKELAILGRKDGEEVCSTNDMVTALFWRVHTRAQISHGSKSEYTYSGAPKDLRHSVGATNYLGNMIVLCHMFATKSFVLDNGLVPVAQLVRRNLQNGSAAGLLQFIEAVNNGAPDVLTMLYATDAPSAGLSNLSRFPGRHVDFGLGELGSSQLRGMYAPYMAHAMDDRANGFLVSICLADSMLAAYLSDEEFMSYADHVY